MDKDQSNREIRAYFALQGASGAAGNRGDWRNDVSAALRSNAPLSSEFREALAKAIDGDLLGFRLELVADHGEKKRRQDIFGGVLVRREYMEIGQWMNEQIALGSTRAKAKRDAAVQFGASPEKCDKALIYYSKAMAWANKAKGSEVWVSFENMGVCPEDALLSIFHQKDAKRAQPQAA